MSFADYYKNKSKRSDFADWYLSSDTGSRLSSTKIENKQTEPKMPIKEEVQPEKKSENIFSKIRKFFVGGREFDSELQKKREEDISEASRIFQETGDAGTVVSAAIKNITGTGTIKERAIAGVKIGAESIAGISSLLDYGFEKVASIVGDENTVNYLKRQRERADDPTKMLAEFARPSGVEEEARMAFGDILSILPASTKSVISGLSKETTKIGVQKTLAREGLEVSDDIASMIAKETSEQKIGALLSNNISPTTKKPSFFTKQKASETTSEYLSRAEAEDAIPSQIERDFSKLGDESLSMAYQQTQKTLRKPVSERIGETVKDIPTMASEAFLSRFSRIGKLQKDALKNAGINVPKTDRVSIQKEFENFVSAENSARARVNDFKDEVVMPIVNDGLMDDFKAYLHMKRADARLKSGTKTGTWTTESASAGIEALKRNLGDEKFAVINSAASRFQDYGDEVIQTLHDGGIISSDSLKYLRESTDFYAPYKLMKHIGDDSFVGKTTKSMNLSKQDVVRAMEGISDDDFLLSDITQELAKKIYTSRIISAKNRATSMLESLADIDGSGVRRIRTTENVEKRIPIAKEVRTLSKENRRLGRLLRTRGRWEDNIRKELKELNVSGLERFYKSKSLKRGEIESSVLQMVNPSTGEKRYKTIKRGDLKYFDESVDHGVAGKEIDGWIYHLTAKTPKKMRDVGFIDSGVASIDEINILSGKPRKSSSITVKRKDGKIVSVNQKPVTFTKRETVDFVDALINLPDKKIVSIQKKIATRDKRLSKVVGEILDIKNEIRDNKNIKSQKISELKDLSDLERSAAENGKGIVTFMRNGITNILELPKPVADAVSGLNVRETGAIINGLRFAMIPARAGITTLNVGFQIVNAMADTARTATISKFRIKSPADAAKFSVDVFSSLVQSIGGNFDETIANITKGKIRTKGVEYKDAENLGLFSGTMSQYVSEIGKKYTPEVRTYSPKEVLRKPLDIFDNLSSSIEEMSKLVAYKRGKRLVEEGKMSPSDMLYEIRNYAGSPDFSRGGTLTPSANVLLMFFNARIQGLSQDLKRLSGYSDGGSDAAKSWSTIGSLVGLPVAYVSIMNSTKYKEDYNSLPEWERANNIVIFKDSFIEDESGQYVRDGNGKPIRDAWKIPVRDTLGAVKNLVESAVKTAVDEDETFMDGSIKFLNETLEGFSPINISGENAQERIESILSSANPTLKALIEIGTGRDLYRHRDIVPEYIGTVPSEDLPAELRYKDSTPSWAITLGKWTGMSPMVIEKVTQNFGSGMFTQFKGTDQRGNALSKRFIRSTYYKENEGIIDVLKGMNEQEAIIGMEEYSRAKVITEMLSGKSIEEQKNILGDLSSRGEINESVYNHIKKIAVQKKYGYSAEDMYLNNLEVKSGARAVGIYRILKEKNLSVNEQKQYLARLSEKKILSNSVYEQLVQIIQSKQTK